MLLLTLIRFTFLNSQICHLLFTSSGGACVFESFSRDFRPHDGDCVPSAASVADARRREFAHLKCESG